MKRVQSQMKTNGHRPAHRNHLFLLKDKILTKEELFLFEYYINQMDFNISHALFGTFTVDFSSIAELLGYSTLHPCNAVREKHDKLLNLGFIHVTDKKDIFAIHNPKRYIASTKKWQGQAGQFESEERNKELKDFIQNIASNVQLNEQSIHTTEQIVQQSEQFTTSQIEEESPRYLVSSKVENLSVAQRVVNQRSFTDYQEIYDEVADKRFLPEDMKWLDDHFDAQGRYLP